VQLDATGVPVAWRLFPFGAFTITKDGETFAGEFTAAHAERILAHARQKGKGHKVPIDAEHGLKALADRLGVEEADLVPLLNRRAVTLGFGALALREEPPEAAGLWLEDVEWNGVDLRRPRLLGGPAASGGGGHPPVGRAPAPPARGGTEQAGASVSGALQRLTAAAGGIRRGRGASREPAGGKARGRPAPAAPPGRRPAGRARTAG
jgi:hypothetical protein